MDLIEQRKFVEQQIGEHLAASVSACGLSLKAAWEYKREFTFKNPIFWGYLIQLSNENFLALFKDERSLDKSFRCVVGKSFTYHFGQATVLTAPLLKFKLCSIKSLFDTAFTRFIKTQADCRKYIQRLSPSQSDNFCTGPPKGFVPIPDIEIGGCARNDSLPAPVIN